MDGLVGGAWQQLPNLGRLQSDHAAQLDGGVVDDPLADRTAVRRALARAPRLELAFDLCDADRQQRGSALTQRRRRTFVDDQSPLRWLRVLEPQLEARN